MHRIAMSTQSLPQKSSLGSQITNGSILDVKSMEELEAIHGSGEQEVLVP